ncbi:hypothetical protein Tco_0493907 [Tanacetum coccineum]
MTPSHTPLARPPPRQKEGQRTPPNLPSTERRGRYTNHTQHLSGNGERPRERTKREAGGAEKRDGRQHGARKGPRKENAKPRRLRARRKGGETIPDRRPDDRTN